MDHTITCNRCKAEVTHICNPALIEDAVRIYSWRPECTPAAIAEDPDIAADESIPFLSETYLYTLLGKEDARTLLYSINNLLRSVGLDPNHIQQMAWERLDKEKKEREAAEERQRKWRERKKGKDAKFT